MKQAKPAMGPEHEVLTNHALASADQAHQGLTGAAGKLALRKKTRPRASQPARSLQPAPAGQLPAEKLAGRYCGSDDLAPSFIQRKDRRCRACFNQRYRSAAPAAKTKVKE